MELTIFNIIFIIMIILIPFAIYYQFQKDKKRRKAYQNWAQSYNWYYNPKRDGKICRNYKHSNLIRFILSISVFDVVKGTWDGYSFLSFNVHFKYQNKSTHYIGGVLIHLEQSFPNILIRPKNRFDLFGNIVGFKDNRPESVEFSKYFTVSCKNKDFAYDFCNPKMMEYLLSQPHSYMEIEVSEDALIIFNYYQSAMNPSEVEENLNQLIQLRKLMPN
ncbi:hypothetical protein NIES267_14300 [Calothrix parasitica NIES-267]|uniref:Uncharacterized protein n=1 Tax=Calothrix parasitica NIES-267 TaxID=1973488 RepID=A0A1Z4LL42_9CYAN|nr:hypothetical protein NIES267_14300 [Calothrix parasitica NIES-267]